MATGLVDERQTVIDLHSKRALLAAQFWLHEEQFILFLLF